VSMSSPAAGCCRGGGGGGGSPPTTPLETNATGFLANPGGCEAPPAPRRRPCRSSLSESLSAKTPYSCSWTGAALAALGLARKGFRTAHDAPPWFDAAAAAWSRHRTRRLSTRRRHSRAPLYTTNGVRWEESVQRRGTHLPRRRPLNPRRTTTSPPARQRRERGRSLRPQEQNAFRESGQKPDSSVSRCGRASG
jgi:hypothetical protein